MDGLAVLCNLHAEGPATLRVLHRAGIRTLQDLRSIRPERLAELLDAPQRSARRFVEEARLLAEQVALEAEETGTR